MECEARSYAVHDPMHIFLKLPRPVDIPIEVDGQLLPILYAIEYCIFYSMADSFCSYRVPAGPPGGILVRERPKGSSTCLRCNIGR